MVFLAISGMFTLGAPVWGYTSNRRVSSTFDEIEVQKHKQIWLKSQNVWQNTDTVCLQIRIFLCFLFFWGGGQRDDEVIRI